MSDRSMLAGVRHSDGLAEVSDLVESGSPTPLGRRAFIAGTAGAVAATALSTTANAAVPPGASYYQPVGPVRLADTRTYQPYANVAKNFQRISDRVIRIKVRNSPYVSIPANAIAVVVSIAVIYNGQQGWVQAVPAGNTSNVSNVNLEPGDGAVANMATVRLSADGKIDVRGVHPYDVVVDVLGVYLSTSQKERAGRLKFLPKTRRALDQSRVARRWQSVPINFGVPSNAQAVVVNLTAAAATAGGFFTARATRTAGKPKTSNLNFAVGETRAAGAIVPLGQNGSGPPSIEVYSDGDARMIVDVTGYITGKDDTESGDGLFVPVNPNRVMDTRRPADVARTGKARLWLGWTRAFELPQNTGGFGARSQMSGVAMNTTLVTAMNYGFVTVLPAQTQRDEVSNLNPTRVGHTVANHVISQASTRGIEMYALCGGDMIADLAGWYTGSPRAITKPSPPVDPPPQQAPFNWLLTVPRMSLQNWVIPNAVSGDPVVDSGNTWHWTNTGMIGDVGASIVVFGHRTSKGGPYRYQHLLRSGDELIIDTPDQRHYRYRYVGEQLTNSSGPEILKAARSNSSGTTFTLVACTGRGTPQNPGVLNDQPLGGIAWRIVSTFVLVDWKDTAPRGNY